jgi:hypothetical protein
MNWLTYEPRPQDIPSARFMTDSGFPDHLARIQRPEAEAAEEWQVAMEWWRQLDRFLVAPTGLLAWGTRGALATMVVLCRRLMCWQGLPVAKGVYVAPVAYIEARDLHSREKYDEVRDAGTLLVAGIGTIEYGAEKEIELIVGLAKQRSRAGRLTFWLLDPVGTARSAELCQRIDAILGPSVVRLNTPAQE